MAVTAFLKAVETAVLLVDIQVADLGNITVTQKKGSHYFTSRSLLLSASTSSMVLSTVMFSWYSMPSAALQLEHGSPVTAGQAHDCFDRHQAVWSGFANLDAQVGAQLLHEFIRAAQGAGQVGADLHAVFSGLLVMVKRVKANNLGHIGGGDIQHSGNIFHGCLGDKPIVALGQV